MRLLNTESFKLREFLNEKEIPLYAIYVILSSGSVILSRSEHH